MKAKLEMEFNLDEPEERQKLKSIASDEATALKCLLFDFDNHMRGIVKYSGDDVHEEYVKAVDEMRGKLYELLNEEGININE